MTCASRTLFAALAVASACIGYASAQPAVITTPSRQTLEEASQNVCDGVSVVVQRCAVKGDDPNGQPGDDALKKSRAAAKAAFDRRDKTARDAALAGSKVPASTPIGDAQRLGAVTVTSQAAEKPLSIEEVLQRALNPGVVIGPNGTVSHFGADGVRYDCIAQCVGPACCATVRSLPNPARDSNSIGR